MRRFLDSIFRNKVMSATIPWLFVALLYSVFLIYGEGPDKATLAVVFPIVCALAWGSFYFIVYIQVKNPFCPAKFLDFFELFCLAFFSISTIPNIIMFLLNVKEEFTAASCLGFVIWSAVSVAHNKRKH